MLDNDLKNPLEDQKIQAVISTLQKQNKEVRCIYPESINHKKTDYNDHAMAGQFSAIERYVVSVTESQTQTKNEQQLNHSVDQEVELEI